MVGFNKGLGCGCCVDSPPDGELYCNKVDPWTNDNGILYRHPFSFHDFGIALVPYYGTFEYDRETEFDGTPLSDGLYPPWRTVGNHANDSASSLAYWQAYDHGHNARRPAPNGGSNGLSMLWGRFTPTYNNLFEARTRQQLIFIAAGNQSFPVPPGPYLSRISGYQMVDGYNMGISGNPPVSRTFNVLGYGNTFANIIYSGIDTAAWPRGFRLEIGADIPLNFFPASNFFRDVAAFNSGQVGWDLTIDHTIYAICTETEITYEMAIRWQGFKLSVSGSGSIIKTLFEGELKATKVQDTTICPLPRMMAGVQSNNFVPFQEPSAIWHNDGTVETAIGNIRRDWQFSRIDNHLQARR